MSPMPLAQRVSIGALAAFVTGAGVMHFVSPQFFIDIVPDYLPNAELLVIVSGVFEILGGVGLLVPATRRFAALGLVALFIAVFPANIHMAVHHITPTGSPTLPSWMPWARLPLQGLLIWWAYGIAVSQQRRQSTTPRST